MIKRNFIKYLSYLFFLINLLSLVACNSNKSNLEEVSGTRLNKKIITVFENDSKYVFGNLIDKEIYSTYNADRLIFQVKVNDLSTLNYLNLINGKLLERGWRFKEKYKQAYVYCDSKLNQLEVIAPLDLNFSYSFGEGQTIKQLSDVWNVSFTHSINKRYICNSALS